MEDWGVKKESTKLGLKINTAKTKDLLGIYNLPQKKHKLWRGIKSREFSLPRDHKLVSNQGGTNKDIRNRLKKAKGEIVTYLFTSIQ